MNRIEYIDCLRGFTMVLVVYSHVIVFSYGADGASFMNGIFMTFRMPLFFFISGFLSYTIWNIGKLKDKLIKRVKKQLLPTCVMFSLYELWVGNYNFRGIAECMKDGYWFTLVVFILFVIFSLLCCFLDYLSTSKQTKIIVLGVEVLVVTFIVFQITKSSQKISDYLCLSLVAKYAPYFYLGIISKMYYEKLHTVIENTMFMSACLILYGISYSIPITPMTVCRITGIIIILSYFHKNRDFFCIETLVGRILSFIGRNTISIYLLHYFVFKYLKLSSISSYCIDNDIQLMGETVREPRFKSAFMLIS